MKNIHKFSLGIALFAAAIITTGCGIDNERPVIEKTKPARLTAATDAKTEKPDTETTAVETPTEKYQLHFRSGAWQGESGYYLFSGETSGRTLSYDRREGVAFEYEAFSDGTAVFHMGAAENNTNVTFTTNGEYEVYITWEDGRTETLLHVDECDYDNFNFATTDEVKEAALKFFDRQNGHRPSGADVKSSGHKVEVELYDMVDDERTVVANYVINRITLMGSDDGFENLNFNEPQEEKKD